MGSGLGVDLGSSAIKAVRIRKKGSGWQLLKAAKAVDRSPPPPKPKPGKVVELPPRVLPADVRGEFKRNRLTGNGTVGITGRDLIVKYVTTPPVPPWKLQMIMDLEIKGTSGSGVCGDFANLDIPGELSSELVAMVAVSKTEYVNRQMALAAESGLGAQYCTPNAVGLFNVFLASAQYQPGETTAVLDIGRDNVDLVIQADGILFFARGVPGGGRSFTDAVASILDCDYDEAEQYKCRRAKILTKGDHDEQALKISSALSETADSLASSVRSAAMFCKAQTKLKALDIDRLVISGGGSRLSGLRKYLQRKTDLPVEVLDPVSLVDLSALPREQKLLFEKGAGVEMSVALGLAMMNCDSSLFRLEIIPDAVIASRKFWGGTMWTVAAGVMLAAALGLEIYGANQKLQNSRTRRDLLTEILDGEDGEGGLRAQEKNFKAELDRNTKLASEGRQMAAPVQQNVPVLEFLHLLKARTPEGITLRKLSVSRPQSEGLGNAGQVEVMISGTADAKILGGDLYQALETYRLSLNNSERLKLLASKVKVVETGKAGGKSFSMRARVYTLGIDAADSTIRPDDLPPGSTIDEPVIIPHRGVSTMPTMSTPAEVKEPQDSNDTVDAGGNKF
jgi:type IV pilus assembly protein PilM